MDCRNRRQEEFVSEIMKRCGRVRHIPTVGWLFECNKRTLLYIAGRDASMLRLCVPHLLKVADYDAGRVAAAVNDTNRHVKYIKAVILDGGSVAVNYDHHVAEGDDAGAIVEHVIKALDFACDYLMRKLSDNEAGCANGDEVEPGIAAECCRPRPKRL